MKQKIIPFLWFSHQAEEAVKYYTALFDGSSVKSIARYTETGQEQHKMEPGTAMTIDFELCGQSFTALNGGKHVSFNPSVSFFVICTDENAVNRLWKGLTDGGRVLMPLDRYAWSEHYGWGQDQYGVSWQISMGNKEDTGQWISPCLMFTGPQQGRAEDAINFYTSVFRNAAIEGILRYQDEAPDPDGHVKHAQFTLEGGTLMMMESAQAEHFPLNEAVSFVIRCTDQDEVDYYWEKLTEGTDEKFQQCGWLKDAFGVWWQVVPEALPRMLTHADASKVKRVTSALLKMKKLDISTLEAAFESN